MATLAPLIVSESTSTYHVLTANHSSDGTMLLDTSGLLCCFDADELRQRGVVDALTTDRHFEQAGFRRLLEG